MHSESRIVHTEAERLYREYALPDNHAFELKHKAIIDRFGRPYVPKEWFMVPLFVIDEAVDRIRDGTIVGYRYDPKSAQLIKLTS